MTEQNTTFALLDTPGGGALLFSGWIRTLTVQHAGELAAVCAAAESMASAGLGVLAMLDYALGYALEPGTGEAPAQALATFLIFSQRRELSPAALAQWLLENAGDPPRPARLLDFSAQLDATTHAAALRRIREYIAAGDCYQINFTFFFAGRCLGDPLALYARLRRAQPVTCGGFIAVPGLSILSLSPELFIERSAGRILARPMKGTARRLGDSALDTRARHDLARSAKDRAENVMIVDLIRNDLGRIAAPGSVKVESLCEIEAYPSLYQMTSTVSAISHARLADVLRALFPCGSITGAPKVRAMQIIRSLENEPRGLYTGAMGCLGANGDFRFNVAIRTLTIGAGGSARLGVGSGIVWDSEPAAEYAECLLKASFVAAADPGFCLIETLRLEEGVFALREAHMLRLQTSARAMSFAFDAQKLAERLDALAARAGAGVFRVRLTLASDGEISTVCAALPETPPKAGYALATQRLASDNLWLRYKTTERALYDAALRDVEATPGLFDMVFLNERGEVCEGARSNVFVRPHPGAPLLTPPLTCGLLPGVLRGHLLASGAAREQVLMPQDLRSASAVYLGNALRGLVPVQAMDGVCAVPGEE